MVNVSTLKYQISKAVIKFVTNFCFYIALSIGVHDFI